VKLRSPKDFPTGTQVQISNGLKTGDVIVADARRDVAAGTKVNPVFSR
jgi:hypothetical protein